ncbi:MAG TPA: hypothetical protein DD738_14855 [Ruminiclostridium sp.]|nr:hypothetical protein [Ruminiclostridium sp.]
MVREQKDSWFIVDMCGEMAADAECIPFLAQAGLDEFSVGIDAIAQTKYSLLSQPDMIEVSNRSSD